ncbi:MAG: serine hydrolase [Candidatus Binatia bacterium]|nr:serine hydrolase [Candidatus Binatia bacterium]MDG2011384.1 serine hydrolase [Candidatus Binatia bacterium]HAC81541.1 EstA family serine hydrolase [Deltaproteobacteria bacterium]
MSELVEIHGTCDPRFQRVADIFAQSFASGDDLGASVNVTWEGAPVVDLWAGFADEERTRPWMRDSLVNVFSTTKGMTALCALRLVEDGLLDLEQPVARYWPEFAAAGKQELPVRLLMNHQAGLPAIGPLMEPESLYDWEAMVGALAAQEPWWVPGTKHGYHAISFGFLVGELVRRVTGRSVGTYFREELAGPLGLDFHIGLPESEDHRVVPLVEGPVHESEGPNLMEAIFADPEGMLAKAFLNPPIDPTAIADRDWRAAEIPAANGHGTAAALARIYGILATGGEADGVHVLSPETIARARTEESYGLDAILPLVSRFGVGFALPPAEEPTGPNLQAFGHAGMGGSYGQADPEYRMGFGYTMNLMHTGSWLVDPRPRALLGGVYESLDAVRG